MSAPRVSTLLTIVVLAFLNLVGFQVASACALNRIATITHHLSRVLFGTAKHVIAPAEIIGQQLSACLARFPTIQPLTAQPAYQVSTEVHRIATADAPL